MERLTTRAPRTLLARVRATAGVVAAVLYLLLAGMTPTQAADDPGEQRLSASPGCFFSDGVAAARFREETLRWTRQAAERGVWAAQFYLGSLLWEGNGVPRDRVAALTWFHLAADTPDGNDRQAALETLHRLSAQLTQAEDAEVARRARAWRDRERLAGPASDREFEGAGLARRKGPAP